MPHRQGEVGRSNHRPPSRSTHPQRGEDGQSLQQGDADQHGAEAAAVHEYAEGERGEREAGVEAGIDEAVDAAIGGLAEARGGCAAHQQVARGAGEAGAVADSRHQRQNRPGRQRQRRERHGEQRGGADGGRDEAFVLAFLRQETAGQDAAGAAGEIGGKGSRPGRQRQPVELLQDRRRKVLDRAESRRDQEKEGETQPHRRGAQESEGRDRLAGLPGRCGVQVARRVGEGTPPPEQQRQREQGDAGGAQGGGPPAGGGGDRRQEYRRQRPAEVAREAVDRKGAMCKLRLEV